MVSPQRYNLSDRVTAIPLAALAEGNFNALVPPRKLPARR